MDIANRHLRLVKDNVFSLESGLKAKIQLYFEKDLEQTRMLLEESKRKFAEYQRSLNSHVKGEVKDNINNLEVIMRK